MGWEIYGEYSRQDAYGNIRDTHDYKVILKRVQQAELEGKDEVLINCGRDEFYWWNVREIALCMNYDFGYRLEFKKDWRRQSMVVINLKEKENSND